MNKSLDMDMLKAAGDLRFRLSSDVRKKHIAEFWTQLFWIELEGQLYRGLSSPIFAQSAKESGHYL